MPDQWDPKYPKDLPLWYDDYVFARGVIYLDGSPWRPAFAAVVAAEAAGELHDLKEFYRGTSHFWSWWMGLWDLYYKPMFLRDYTTWPVYAQAVFDAVPPDWLDAEKEGGPGEVLGIPTQWDRPDEWRRIWAFKSTVLFVAGLIEGQLPPIPEVTVEKLGARLDLTLQPLVARMSNISQEIQDVQRTLQPLVGTIEGIDQLIASRVNLLVQPLKSRLEQLMGSPVG